MVAAASGRTHSWREGVMHEIVVWARHPPRCTLFFDLKPRCSFSTSRQAPSAQQLLAGCAKVTIA